MKVTLKLSQDPAAGKTHTQLTVERCVALLSKLKISSTAFYTLSAVDDHDGLWQAEQGVCIDIYSVDKATVCEQLWPHLEREFGLECIHVHELGHGFNGCIFDWMRESACPASARRKAREAPATVGIVGNGVFASAS